MNFARLIRVSESEEGTFGAFTLNAKPFCVTLEPPDKQNMAYKSSIPAGQYVCKRHMSPRFGETFIILDVHGRSWILFHAGNTVDHTSGCILLAQHYGKLKGNLAVLNSGNTFKRFMKALEGVDEFHLTISEDY